MVGTKKVRTADGGEYVAPAYRLYRDEAAGVLRQNYEENTPQEFVSDQEQISELERDIQRMRLLQQQHVLMGNPSGHAALELQIQALTVELNVLKAKYGVT
jgi:hypothetical protein